MQKSESTHTRTHHRIPHGLKVQHCFEEEKEKEEKYSSELCVRAWYFVERNRVVLRTSSVI